MFRTKGKAFTLIELLIVVAIIAILALIAVPNFLEAQTRAKVSRCNADMRSLATALEAYCVDNNLYPFYVPSIDNPANLCRLSTPVAYITSPLLKDPFKNQPPGTNPQDPAAGNLYLNLIYIPFQRQANFADDWPANVDNKFRRAPAFPRVEGQDLGYGPPEDARKFPGTFHWVLCGYGPDQGLQFDDDASGYNRLGIDAYMPYDPTNGTVSYGDVFRFSK